MKVTVEASKKGFQPVKIAFTLETQGELNALGSLFNTYPILQALDRISGRRTDGWRTAYQVLSQLGANIHSVNKFPTRYCD